MATARKLPSGNWRARVYSHTTPDGKKHYESFTGHTKQEAEMMANKFAKNNDRIRSADINIREAIDNYMNKHDKVFSPSTLYGYELAYKRLEPMYNLRIRKIKSADIQAYIAELIDKGYAPKTIKNTYSLLTASLAFADVDTDFRVTLPSTVKKAPVSPENKQIEALYENATPMLKKAILFGCLSLRRGEISALKYGDLKGNIITIHADMVWGKDKQWHYKPIPKTSASIRTVYLPDVLVQMLGTGKPDDYIMGVKPNAIGNAFLRLKTKMHIDIKFHDLRHYFASIAKVLDIPDNYTATLGGWQNGSKVLKEIYQNNIVSMNEVYAAKINEHIEKIAQGNS